MNNYECEKVTELNMTDDLEQVKKCVREYLIIIDTIKSVYYANTWKQDLTHFTEPVHDKYMSKLKVLLGINDI